MLSDVRTIQELMTKFKSMNVDATEYACLKGIVVLKTGELYFLFIGKQRATLLHKAVVSSGCLDMISN